MILESVLQCSNFPHCYVLWQANLCSGLRVIHSPQFIKKKLQFLAELVLEPGSSDSETSTLPMSYETNVENATFDAGYYNTYIVGI